LLPPIIHPPNEFLNFSELAAFEGR
jgi:hypothetical protein